MSVCPCSRSSSFEMMVVGLVAEMLAGTGILEPVTITSSRGGLASGAAEAVACWAHALAPTKLAHTATMARRSVLLIFDFIVFPCRVFEFAARTCDSHSLGLCDDRVDALAEVCTKTALLMKQNRHRQAVTWKNVTVAFIVVIRHGVRLVGTPRVSLAERQRQG